jgi:hypothetical protein
MIVDEDNGGVGLDRTEGEGKFQERTGQWRGGVQECTEQWGRRTS